MKSNNKIKTLKADYVIVGLGAADALMANRLSKKYSVIGIEAGPNDNHQIAIKDSNYVEI